MATDSKMQIEYIKLEQIKPYERNPRKNDDAVKYVKQSIKEFGFKVPIVLDKDNVIVAGHTRYKASKELGLKEVPCIHADDLNGEQIKAFRLADNKVSEFAEWDDSLLNLELDSLEMDMTDFGFLDSVFVEEQKEIIEDEVSEDVEPLCKLGDVWQLGNHRLMCGDATNENDVEKLTGGGTVNALITDPPYNVAYEGKTDKNLKIMNDSMDSNSFLNFLTDAFTNAYKVLSEGGAFYVWYASKEHINFEKALNNVGLTVKEQLIWNKNALVFGRQDYHWKHEPCLYGWKDGASHNWYADRKQTTVIDFDKPLRNGEHPTMKPVGLIAYLINNSTKENDLVLDIFGGSGTTLIACEQMNRKCLMMELDPHYCDVIINRWETLTGDKATLLESK